LVWDYNEFAHYDLKYMKFTLPSDSTIREDLVLLKSGNEQSASEAKTKLEELQRHDRKMRAEFGGSDH
jgi:sialic acid synthase SpsE